MDDLGGALHGQLNLPGVFIRLGRQVRQLEQLGIAVYGGQGVIDLMGHTRG